ncbi:hypothetical protein [Clostridium weizhouense]|uniref:ABC-2 family transporter protein n=1 Tax=Clostridium weizhouense TaxID=2859781 RepID=A0ABS7ASL6_9CLOT|nr:hypothetical protein [Clostridium weizhouense]MBW6411667.1 hypothetical protein [Clostridium weizhouense]
MFFQEVKRGFSRISFKIALFIGTVACILSSILMKTESYSIQSYIKAYEISSYDNFIFFNLNSISNILILIFPILSVLSYSDSYLEDINSGFIKCIHTRYSKKKYLMYKFLSNFVVGGLGFVIPLIINFIILILSYPSLPTHAILGKQTILCGGLFPALFYTYPILYIALWLVIYFMYAGAFASISLGVSTIIKNKFVVLFIPFLLCNVIGILLDITNKHSYSPLSFLYLSIKQDIKVIILEFIGIMIVSMSLFYLGGTKNEIY